MTKSAGPALRRLHDAYGDAVRFVTLYVREAHPGDDVPQPETLEQKLAHARNYAERDGIGWTVAVDDIDGTLHRELDPKPHAAYLLDPEGTVLWRTLWANDARLLREALDAAAGGEAPEPAERQSRLIPMLSGTGSMWESWQEAGGHAPRDVLREVPPVYLSGRIAHLFRPLPPVARGALGMTLAMAPLVAAVAAVRRIRSSAPED